MTLLACSEVLFAAKWGGISDDMVVSLLLRSTVSGSFKVSLDEDSDRC
jgi:hypothetical protein